VEEKKPSVYSPKSIPQTKVSPIINKPVEQKSVLADKK
jgi:hypothetical protein